MLRRLPVRWRGAVLATAPTGSGAATAVAPPPGAVSARGPAAAVTGGTAADRRRYRLAALVGGVLALVTHVLFLLGGGFLRRNHLSGFYDAQAHSLLDLRWDVPEQVLSIEAFLVDDRAYMYFGPTPALLRLPVAAVTDALDGRLTSVSLLLALAVSLVATTEIAWRVRQLVRRDAPVGRRELVGAGAFTFLLGAGSALLVLSSAPVVYHEAIAWGVALALAADAALLAYATGHRAGALAAATALATLAVLARPSVGLGPVAALGLLLAVEVVAALRSRRGAGRPPRRLGALAVATALPVVLYAGVNIAKFDTAFGVPWQAQALSRFDPPRQAFLEESGGTLFGARYAPTAVLQYVRPDALSVDRAFPWLDFPPPAEPLFDVPFDVVDRSSSVPTTMPWLVVLAVVGVVALVTRGPGSARRAAGALWAPLLGALAAAPVTVAIAYIAARYVADFVPLLVLPATVGLAVLVSAPRRPWARGLLWATAGLGLVGLAVNLALAVQFQGLYGPTTTEEERARLVRWQTAADDLVPGGQAPEVRRQEPGDALPRRARAGDLVVVGDCRGLYQHDGRAWRAVELTPELGRLRLRTRLGAPGPGGSAELLALGRGAASRSLTVQVGDDGRARLVLRLPDRTVEGDRFEPGEGASVVDAVFDRRLNAVDVEVGDDVVLGDSFYGAPDDEVRVSPDWPAPVELLPGGTRACDGLAG